MVYGYNQVTGHLMHFENCSWGMTDEQLTAVMLELRNQLSNDRFKQWVAEHGHKIIKVEEDLSFERFWLLYDNPRDKFKCEPLWKKMSDTQRQYVFFNIESYKRYMKQNTWYNQLLPETYLKNSWRNEWDKIEPKK
jgi:predicted Fe-S protein YdhL (DUF1289 family)